jgi:hypothetical protein
MKFLHAPHAQGADASWLQPAMDAAIPVIPSVATLYWYPVRGAIKKDKSAASNVTCCGLTRQFGIIACGRNQPLGGA